MGVNRIDLSFADCFTVHSGKMSDIKVPTGPGQGLNVDAVSDVSKSVDAATQSPEVEAVAGEPLDAVEQIAADVTSGKITRDEAVEQLLAHVLDSDMVQSAPEAVRSGLREALQNLLDSDPHLGALKAAIGPREIE